MPCLIEFVLYERETPISTLRTQLLQTFETSYFLLHNWYFTVVWHRLAPSIDFLSLPIFIF